MKTRGLGLVSVGLVSAGCYTTSNVARVPPLQTRYPVSASPSYVSDEGTVVYPAEYRVTQSFGFERQVLGTRHEETETTLRLEPDLDRIVQSARGDAVTRLKIEVIDYDPGSHAASAKLKSVGWMTALSGGCGLALGGAMAADGDTENAQMGLAVGGALAGLGLSMALIGALIDGPSRWRLWVTGSVVQRTEGSHGSVSAEQPR